MEVAHPSVRENVVPDKNLIFKFDWSPWIKVVRRPNDRRLSSEHIQRTIPFFNLLCSFLNILHPTNATEVLVTIKEFLWIKFAGKESFTEIVSNILATEIEKHVVFCGGQKYTAFSFYDKDKLMLKITFVETTDFASVCVVSNDKCRQKRKRVHSHKNRPALFHCPGHHGEYRGYKCDPATKREEDIRLLIQVFVKQILKPEGRIPRGPRPGRVQLRNNVKIPLNHNVRAVFEFRPLHKTELDKRFATSINVCQISKRCEMRSPDSDLEDDSQDYAKKNPQPISKTSVSTGVDRSEDLVDCTRRTFTDKPLENNKIIYQENTLKTGPGLYQPEPTSSDVSFVATCDTLVHGIQRFAENKHKDIVPGNKDSCDATALKHGTETTNGCVNIEKDENTTIPITTGQHIIKSISLPLVNVDDCMQGNHTEFVVQEFVNQLIGQFIQCTESNPPESKLEWNAALSCFTYQITELCKSAYKKNGPLSEAEEIACAFHITNELSFGQMEELATSHEINQNQKNIILFTCFLLRNPHFAQLLSKKSTQCHDTYDTKFDIMKDLILEFQSDKRITMIPENWEWLNKCTLMLKDKSLIQQVQLGQGSLLRENISCRGSSQEKRIFAGSNNIYLVGVKTDGNIYDRARDPPGQRSVYIPPGDANMESYRLSTFIKYPQEVPVNPRHLASAGFFYTGYKDRVKCFSCGLCCENWVFGDDVRSAQWHRSDCAFMRGGDSGNVPIGGGALARFMMAPRSQEGNIAMETGPPISNFTASSGTAQQVQQNSQVPSAGSLLLSHSAGSNQSVPMQTARPVARNQPLFQIVEFATIPSAYHENFLKNLDLRKESERVRTFEHWPSERPTVYPADLARSGFFYLGNLDRVQCFSCGGVLRNWNYGDNVQAEHRRHFPHCKMCQGAESRNVQLTPDERAAVPSQQTVFHEPPDPSENEARDLQNMFQCQYPVSPHMRNEDTRFETFDHRWPASQVNATPRQIARAGFFFLGERDRVKCWYCNGGLQNWDPQDEPWTEHAKWFPTCEFLLQRKGPDFVHRMVSMFPNLPRPLLRGPHDVAPPNPGRRIQYGTASARAPSPPPPIIDPQAEMQRERQKIQDAMNSDIVKAAIEMGFDRKVVRHVVKRRIRRAAMCTTVAELVDDVTGNTSDLSDSDDEENENSMQAQPSTSAKTPGTGGQPESTSSSLSGQPIPAGLAAASHLSSMENEERTPSMQERIEELQEERKCKICLDNMADVVFVPCGHLCSCVRCAEALRKCPMCRQRIEKAIRTYMS